MIPSPAPSRAAVLQQNTHWQADIVNKVAEATQEYGDSLVRYSLDSLSAAMRDRKGWLRLVRGVAAVVRGMLLSSFTSTRGTVVLSGDDRASLTPIGSFMGSGRTWRAVRGFGSRIWACLAKRPTCTSSCLAPIGIALTALRSVLIGRQDRRCFYCNGASTGTTVHVDHFVARARYPADLGHNLVLADARCHNAKGERFPAVDHLTRLRLRPTRCIRTVPEDRAYDGLSAEKIDALLRKWLRLLPHPYEARDREAGYRYQISILQAEFSLPQVLDRPVTGRVFFEEVIRENLDIGRPSVPPPACAG